MGEELAIEQQDVERSCDVLEVSRSGYYEWLKRPLSLMKTEDERLWQKIKFHWEKSRQTYGSSRITEKLKTAIMSLKGNCYDNAFVESFFSNTQS